MSKIDKKESIFGLPEEWDTPTVKLAQINVIFYVITTIIGGSFIITGSRAIVLLGFSMENVFNYGLFYTPLSSIFVHGNIAHLGSNLLFLLIFGLKLEERGFSAKAIYFSYIFTGILSTLISMPIFFGLSTVSIGSSGAVFGILGTNVGVERRNKDPNYKRVIGLSFILLVMTGTAPNTNIFAHLIGFFLGVFLGQSDYYNRMKDESLAPDILHRLR